MDAGFGLETGLYAYRSAGYALRPMPRQQKEEPAKKDKDGDNEGRNKPSESRSLMSRVGRRRANSAKSSGRRATSHTRASSTSGSSTSTIRSQKSTKSSKTAMSTKSAPSKSRQPAASTSTASFTPLLQGFHGFGLTATSNRKGVPQLPALDRTKFSVDTGSISGGDDYGSGAAATVDRSKDNGSGAAQGRAGGGKGHQRHHEAADGATPDETNVSSSSAGPGQSAHNPADPTSPHQGRAAAQAKANPHSRSAISTKSTTTTPPTSSTSAVTSKPPTRTSTAKTHPKAHSSKHSGNDKGVSGLRVDAAPLPIAPPPPKTPPPSSSPSPPPPSSLSPIGAPRGTSRPQTRLEGHSPSIAAAVKAASPTTVINDIFDFSATDTHPPAVAASGPLSSSTTGRSDPSEPSSAEVDTAFNWRSHPANLRIFDHHHPQCNQNHHLPRGLGSLQSDAQDPPGKLSQTPQDRDRVDHRVRLRASSVTSPPQSPPQSQSPRSPILSKQLPPLPSHLTSSHHGSDPPLLKPLRNGPADDVLSELGRGTFPKHSAAGSHLPPRSDSMSSVSGATLANTSSRSTVGTTNTMATNDTFTQSAGASSASVSTTSTATKPTRSVGPKPLIMRNNRTYINDPTLAYPLPIDLQELHRQSLRTLLLFQLLGGPITSPVFANKPPLRVLEVGCGSGFWSMMCHRYFAQQGHSVSFTGMDIVPLCGPGPDPNSKPDKDMQWKVVQHDIRHFPWPFAEGEFDLVMVKDMCLVGGPNESQEIWEEQIRVTAPGGVVELWETDHTIRMLRPHAPSAKPTVRPRDGDSSSDEEDDAAKLGVYTITGNTPLSPPMNTFLVEYNGWITKALDARGLSPVPNTQLGPWLLQEAESLTDVHPVRMAVPLSEIRWEREGVGGVVTKGDGKSYIDSSKGKYRAGDAKGQGKTLSTTQAALRRTALETVVGLIHSFEPILREVSGKSQDEWDGWLGKMMNDLMREGGTSWGECLEVGAWSAMKRTG